MNEKDNLQECGLASHTKVTNYYKQLTLEDLNQFLLELEEKSKIMPRISNFGNLWEYRYDDFVIYGSKETILNFEKEVDKALIEELKNDRL